MPHFCESARPRVWAGVSALMAASVALLASADAASAFDWPRTPEEFRKQCANDSTPGGFNRVWGDLAEGKGDYAVAMFCYRASLSKGYKSAASYIAFLYETGRGVRQDHDNAVIWFQIAMASGGMSPRVEYKLGMAYAEGRELPRDLEMASYWLKKAAASGDKDAQLAIATTEPAQTPSPPTATRSAKEQCYTECSRHENMMRINMPEHLGYEDTKNYLNDQAGDRAVCEASCDQMK
jgi:TPR repeat protein